jgi:putative ABC transport system ATP-binding protein
MSTLVLRNIRHAYNGHLVLQLPELTLHPGEHCLVLGQSGSGKTTLLHIMAGLLAPTQGTVAVAGKDLGAMKASERDRFRGRHIGIVFQQMHLLDTLTVAENLMIAPYLAGMPQDKSRLKEVLRSLDLGSKERAYPHELSVGQQQRVVLARAVMNAPGLILADEPTSALDDLRCQQVLDLLFRQADAYNATLVIATHDQRIKDRFDKQLLLDPQ